MLQTEEVHTSYQAALLLADAGLADELVIKLLDMNNATNMLEDMNELHSLQQVSFGEAFYPTTIMQPDVFSDEVSVRIVEHLQGLIQTMTHESRFDDAVAAAGADLLERSTAAYQHHVHGGRFSPRGRGMSNGGGNYYDLYADHNFSGHSQYVYFEPRYDEVDHSQSYLDMQSGYRGGNKQHAHLLTHMTLSTRASIRAVNRSRNRKAHLSRINNRRG